MAQKAVKDFKAVAPRFSLGGQVSSHQLTSSASSNLDLSGASSGLLSPDPIYSRPDLLRKSRLHRHSMSSLLMTENEIGATPTDLEFGLLGATDAFGIDLPPARSLNPELLMKEFTHDEQGTTASPSSMFKSSFAKEVVQNVRKSMSHTDAVFRAEFSKLHNDGDDESAPASSSIAANSESENLWMSSTQFLRLLDKQEAAESGSGGEFVSKVGEARKKLFENPPLKSSDQDSAAMTESKTKPQTIPMNKLKQKCNALGFMFTDKEWKHLRHILQTKFDLPNPSDAQSNTSMVSNEDFFNAVHFVLKKKEDELARRRGKGEELLSKESMKSSDAEMESCRSSDSGLEREHHSVSEMKAQQGSTLGLMSLGQVKDLGTAHFQRQLAERDADLVRVRLECQRLLEDNRHLRDEVEKLRLYSNPKRQLILEREIEDLRWQLSQMERSRKTYEGATHRLVSFLDEVTTALQATSPAHRSLVESTRAGVSRVARRANAGHKRLSLDSSASSLSFMSRAESMPGLNLEMAHSMASGSSASSSIGDHHHSSLRRVQRSQSTHSKRSLLPSLKEDQIQPYENHSIIELAKEEIREEMESEFAQTVEAIAVAQAKDKKIKKRDSLISQKSRTKEKSETDSLSTKAHSISDRDSGRCSLGGSSSGRSTPKVNKYSPVVEGETNKTVKKEKTEKGKSKNLAKSSPDITSGGVTVINVSGPSEKTKGGKHTNLGKLQLEAKLPTTPLSTGSSEAINESMISKSHRLLRSMKTLMAREKKLDITPKKSSSKSRISSYQSSKDKPPNLQLLSHTSFPGLPAFPVLAASHTSPWNC